MQGPCNLSGAVEADAQTDRKHPSMGSDNEGNEDFGLGDGADHVEPLNLCILPPRPLRAPSFAKACHTFMEAGCQQPSLTITADAIQRLDLKALAQWMDQPLSELLNNGAVLELNYEWPRPPEDPRELSECAEPRLWALRADARYPWLPLLLNRTKGCLIQHVAMLVPHDFRPSEGIRFDPQALEIWMTHRLMVLDQLGADAGIPGHQRGNLSLMAASLGFELDGGFWDLLDQAQ